MPASRQAVDRYKRQLATYRDRTSVVLAGSWDRLGTYTEDDVDVFARRTAPVLAGAKTAAVGLSAAFFAVVLSTRPVGVNPSDVTIEPRLRDPFLSAWHAVSEGRPWDEAFQAGRSMSEAVGWNFVTSAARRTGDIVAEKSGKELRGWERVPSADACEWCDLVSGQLYATAESADFGHDRCNCVAVPAA